MIHYDLIDVIACVSVTTVLLLLLLLLLLFAATTVCLSLPLLLLKGERAGEVSGSNGSKVGKKVYFRNVKESRGRGERIKSRG